MYARLSGITRSRWGPGLHSQKQTVRLGVRRALVTLASNLRESFNRRRTITETMEKERSVFCAVALRAAQTATVTKPAKINGSFAQIHRMVSGPFHCSQYIMSWGCGSRDARLGWGGAGYPQVPAQRVLRRSPKKSSMIPVSNILRLDGPPSTHLQPSWFSCSYSKVLFPFPYLKDNFC